MKRGDPAAANSEPRRLRQSARPENHAAGEKMPGRRQNIEHRQPRTARQRERRHGIREHSDKKIGEADSGTAVEIPAAGITGDERPRADLFLGRVKQHPSLFPRVAQSEIESLTGDRV